MQRTYGQLKYNSGTWELSCDPHVRIRAKSLFSRLKSEGEILRMTETVDVCADLHWFMQRYPMVISADDSKRLTETVHGYQQSIARLDDLIDGNYQPRQFDMKFPPREYQKIAAEVLLTRGRLLLADDLGLGKTVSAICTLSDPRTLPAVVVCPPILRRQWEAEIKRFVPQLNCHVITSTIPYELPKKKGRGPDVVVISYYAIRNWISVICKYASSVVFDEAGELCRDESEKYKAAKAIAASVSYRMGLSATPIKNYGGEIYNLMECISPGVFGSKEEFFREWCRGSSTTKPIVKHPNALGAWMKSEHLMLRRTKTDVGRELPDLVKVTHEIDSDLGELKKVSGRAGELAKIILGRQVGSTHLEEMNAVQQMSTLLRQATGMAKAPYVADFVEMLIESGQSVLLYGWHRSVYSIWLNKLQKYKPSFYTGSESDSQKARQKDRFVSGETPLMIMSLRSGIGVDGLQKRCSTLVFGELDWTPSVHEQCAGRLHRDGQKQQVTAYYLVSSSGMDPAMAQVLGIKKDQVEGIRDDAQVLQRSINSNEIVRNLAREYLKANR